MILTETQKAMIESLFHQGFGSSSICVRTGIPTKLIREHLEAKDLRRTLPEARAAIREGVESGYRKWPAKKGAQP